VSPRSRRFANTARGTRGRNGASGLIRLKTSRPDRATLSIEVTGEIDLHTSGDLQRAALADLDPEPGLVILDLRQVTFFGVSAIAALITIRDAVDGRGGHLCVYPSPAVQRVLQPAAMEDRFDVRSAHAPHDHSHA
jgi:anti-anti-sigma factor